MRPTLLNSCASAATAAEARYRIDAAPQAPRSTRVVALDEGARAIVGPLLDRPWRASRFFHYDAAEPRVAGEDEFADVVLTASSGERVRLSDELVDADFMMMVATADEGAAAASAIGNACTLRGIMTAGLILGHGTAVGHAVTALRPHARVLLVSDDSDDVAEILSAVGG
jgi:hypothetical protein